jgi:pleiotropic regulator 1
MLAGEHIFPRMTQVLSRSRAVTTLADGTKQKYVASVAVAKRLASRWPKPKWHSPWHVYRTIAGHLGWVRSIAFDPGNEWFVTGSGDRTIKVWDTASGALKLTMTGHIEQVTGLAISDKFPYMFSCGLDKKVLCWDLEQNKVFSLSLFWRAVFQPFSIFSIILWSTGLC